MGLPARFKSCTKVSFLGHGTQTRTVGIRVGSLLLILSAYNNTGSRRSAAIHLTDVPSICNEPPPRGT
ncbi:hypothetical protein CEXT_219931 [Caerostris extrusa]|uniref:Uncharacterized protein n=1 Tax=Caerostris extrusa TaxID=172846 RepID=A0AAV4SGQ1_CAEEX|nr:hypothetical protein CEXT_219931 [Caerostris extrusa]